MLMVKEEEEEKVYKYFQPYHIFFQLIMLSLTNDLVDQSAETQTLIDREC